MDIKEIQDLIKFVAKSGVSEVELETKGVKLVIKTGKMEAPVIAAPIQAVAPVVAQPVIQAPQVVNTPAVTPAEPAKPAGGGDESKYITIKSPMIGTFYRRRSPDKPPLVNVGDEIKPGTVLCIIEAMKLFNEIESEVSGRVVKILVEDSSPVEYDHPLILVDPS